MDLAAEAQRGEMTSPGWGRHLEHSEERRDESPGHMLLSSACSLLHAF